MFGYDTEMKKPSGVQVYISDYCATDPEFKSWLNKICSIFHLFGVDEMSTNLSVKFAWELNSERPNYTLLYSKPMVKKTGLGARVHDP